MNPLQALQARHPRREWGYWLLTILGLLRSGTAAAAQAITKLVGRRIIKTQLLASVFLLAAIQFCPAGTYSFNLYSGFNLVGGQIAISGDTWTSYLSPGIEDQVLGWNFPLQQCESAYLYDGTDWVAPDGSPVPNAPIIPGQGFFHFNATAFTKTVTRTFTPGPPPLFSPIPLNNWHLVSSQTPLLLDYPGLRGTANPMVPSRTFVWRFNAISHNYEVSRYVGAAAPYLSSLGNWSPAPPVVPLGESAFLAQFSLGGAAPSLNSVVATPAACPPMVQLKLTFNAPVILDPVSAATPSSYKIYQQNAATPGGTVTAVTVEYGGQGCAIGVITAATLTVKLSTQPGNTYYVKAPTLKSVRGINCTGSLPFVPYCTGGPPGNDTPFSSQSIPYQLASGVPVSGSLVCADATPAPLTNVKDCWYSYTPPVSGKATITTCQPMPGCPASDTQLTVYKGNPGTAAYVGMALVAVASAGAQDMGAACSLNSLAATRTFNATAFTTYFVRVSAKTGGALPGDFVLDLTLEENIPGNCNSALLVSANSATPFTLPGNSARWFKFIAPPGTGPWLTEADACQANFSAVVDVFTAPCAGPVASLSTPSCPTTPFTFQATAGATYYVRVQKTTAGAGGGFLQIASGIPAGGAPPVGLNSRVYTILGAPNSVAWDWSASAPPSVTCPAGFYLTGTAGPVFSGNALGAEAIANEFANQINLAAGGSIASVWPAPSFAPTAAKQLRISTDCPANGLVLKVRPNSTQPWCWVHFDALPVAFGPCNFNPDISEAGDPDGLDTDCNGNGRADYLDLMDGISQDINGNGVPDECDGCIGVEVAEGPDSASAGLGGNATISVRAIGTGPFTYQWRKEGISLAGQTNSTLILVNLSVEGAGAYDAVISNPCGQATSAEAILLVDMDPALNIARQGSDIVLTWSDPDYQLQAAPELNNPSAWVDVPGPSELTLPVGGTNQFFRLHQPE